MGEKLSHLRNAKSRAAADLEKDASSRDDLEKDASWRPEVKVIGSQVPLDKLTDTLGLLTSHLSHTIRNLGVF